MARSVPASRFVLALVAAATFAGCAGEHELPTELTADEERLVTEVLELIEIRIARARDEAEGEALREELPPLYDESEIQGFIDRLARDPERGQLVIGTIHDSLTARRERLLRPSSER